MNLRSILGFGQSDSGDGSPENMAGRRPRASDSAPPPVPPDDTPAVIQSASGTEGASLETHTLTRAEKAELGVGVKVLTPPEPPTVGDWDSVFGSPPYTRAEFKKGNRLTPEKTVQHRTLLRISNAFILRIVSRMETPPLSREEFERYRELHGRIQELWRVVEQTSERAAKEHYRRQLENFTATEPAKLLDGDIYGAAEFIEDFAERRQLIVKRINRLDVEAASLRKEVGERIIVPIRELAVRLDAEQRAFAADWSVPFSPDSVLRAAASFGSQPPHTMFNQFATPNPADGIYQLAQALGYWTPEPPATEQQAAA